MRSDQDISEPSTRSAETGARAPIVCMFVYNNMMHDARVRKEARTLGGAGYGVTVLSVIEPGLTPKEEQVEGFRILRINRSILGISRQQIATRITPSRPSARRDVAEATKKPGSVRRSRIAALLMAASRLPFYPLRRVVVFVRFVSAAVRTRADVYHAHDLNTLLMAWTASRLRRTPLIYDTHEVATDRADMHFRWWAALLEKTFVRRAERVICTTATRAEFTRKRYDIPMPIVLRNLPAYVEPQASRLIQERLGLPAGEKIILYQGGIQPQRRLELLLEAARDIRGGVVVFLGSGRLKPQLVEEVKKLGLTDVVRFHDAVPVGELPTWTACAYVGLQILQNTCFNHYSSLSNKLLEYLMAGVPVIASDLPEMRRVIEDTGAGVIIDTSDPRAIASAVNEILADPERREQMSQAAKASRKAYSWEREEHILTELYAQLLPAWQCPPTA